MQINYTDKITSYTEKCQVYIPCSFAYKVVCIDGKFSKLVVLFEGKNAVNKFIKAILEEFDYCKKVIKRYFNKNLVMSVEDETRFQSSNKCWICNKLYTDEDQNVGDHDHITGKYRSLAHSNCNIKSILILILILILNLKLTKKVPTIFHNLRDYPF